MPDNSQARTDNMPPEKKVKHKGLINIVLFAIIIAIIGVIVF